MAKNNSTRKAGDAKRRLLDMSLGMFGLGLVLLVLSSLLARNPALAPVANGLRVPMPWVFFIGAVLLGLYFIVRRAAVPPTKPPAEPTFFAAATTTFQDHVVQPAREPYIRPTREREPARAWSDKVFDDIEWRRFEAVCEALFAQAGFEARSQSHGADGGVDIWLYSRHAQGPAAVVQCKHWRGKPVGVKEMREFFGVMASHGLKRGTFATSSTFTADALRFAKDNGISAKDGSGLLELIASRTAEQQHQLLAIAYEGEYWRPTCASCGVKMVERTPKRGGAQFWGCARYPKCKSTLPMRGAE